VLFVNTFAVVRGHPQPETSSITKWLEDAAVISEHHKPKRPDTVEFHARAVQRVIGTIR
jgi:hypothetical protein